MKFIKRFFGTKERFRSLLLRGITQKVKEKRIDLSVLNVVCRLGKKGRPSYEELLSNQSLLTKETYTSLACALNINFDETLGLKLSGADMDFIKRDMRATKARLASPCVSGDKISLDEIAEVYVIFRLLDEIAAKPAN